MKINRTTVFEIANNTYRLEMLGRVNCYLLLGTERGLLIDCGFGLEPLKPLIDELCPLPYDVCITHADGDHMGACYEWDKVWLHPADNALANDLEHVNFQRFTGMHTNLNPMLKRDADDLSNEDFYAMDELKPITLTPNDLPEFLPLKDGQIFDLGDRKVTVLLVPGHTMGSTVYLDDNTRILFSGDAISAASDIKLITATAGYHNMERLLTYADRFDRIYPAHTGLGPGTVGMNYSLPKDNPDALRAFAYSPGISLARYLERIGKNPIHTFFLEREQGEGRGMPHAADLAYVFGTLDVRPNTNTRTPFDYKVSNTLCDYWTNFAKTGDPNGEGLPLWPRYTAAEPVALHLTDEYIRAEVIDGDKESNKVIEYTIAHPGMLENLEGF